MSQNLRRFLLHSKISLSLAHGFFSYLASFLPWPGATTETAGSVDLRKADRVAIFSHYDRRGRVQAYVRYYLEELRRAGFTIIFVTNRRRLASEALEWLPGICGLIIRRRNKGWDFGAFKDGIQAFGDLSHLQALLLVNDSVYGPLHDIGGILEKMDFDRGDVWGITDSWERRFHLQSFFLLFGPAALQSPAFRKFWRQVRSVRSKIWVIRMYEIGLTRRLVKSGLRCKALNPSRAAFEALVREVRERNILDDPSLSIQERQFLAGVYGQVGSNKPLNATHFFWEYLIANMGCPFVKRDLLRSNPVKVPFLQYWERVIRSATSYDTDLIVQDLEYSMRNRSV